MALRRTTMACKNKMPYSLRKAPKKDLYWVVNKVTGRKYSKSPLPLERAQSQRRAIYASEKGYMRGGSTTGLAAGQRRGCFGGGVSASPLRSRGTPDLRYIVGEIMQSSEMREYIYALELYVHRRRHLVQIGFQRKKSELTAKEIQDIRHEVMRILKSTNYNIPKTLLHFSSKAYEMKEHFKNMEESDSDDDMEERHYQSWRKYNPQLSRAAYNEMVEIGPR